MVLSFFFFLFFFVPFLVGVRLFSFFLYMMREDGEKSPPPGTPAHDEIQLLFSLLDGHQHNVQNCFSTPGEIRS